MLPRPDRQRGDGGRVATGVLLLRRFAEVAETKARRPHFQGEPVGSPMLRVEAPHDYRGVPASVHRELTELLCLTLELPELFLLLPTKAIVKETNLPQKHQGFEATEALVANCLVD